MANEGHNVLDVGQAGLAEGRESCGRLVIRHRIGTFGHMGDGNLHPTFLTDERNKDEMHRVEEAFKEIFTEAIRLGGTITGEHGIGCLRRGYLPLAASSAEIDLMKRIKKAFDPNGIINPGKIIP